jgi:hypothetical protein
MFLVAGGGTSRTAAGPSSQEGAHHAQAGVAFPMEAVQGRLFGIYR